MKVGDRIEATGRNGNGDPIRSGRTGTVIRFDSRAVGDDILIRWDDAERGEWSVEITYSSKSHPPDDRFKVLSSRVNEWEEFLELL